jgi:hypothetical protein
MPGILGRIRLQLNQAVREVDGAAGSLRKSKFEGSGQWPITRLNYGLRFMRAINSAKRGSERSGSNTGLTFN